MKGAQMASTLPPGPTYPTVLASLKWQRQFVELVESAHARFGDVWSMRMTGSTWVFVSEPALIEEIFAADPTVLHGAASVATPALGTRSLLILSEDEHTALRGLMRPLFHQDRVQHYRAEMARICGEELETWPLQQPMPMLPLFQTITLKVIMSVVFGLTGGERQERLHARIDALVAWAQNGLRMTAHNIRFMLGRQPSKAFLAARNPLDEVIYDEIARARRDPALDSREDVLALLIAARFDDGSALTDKDLRDQLMTLLIQGHHSTANALSWAMERLVRHPDVVERLRAEAETEKEEYLGAVVNETLRLFPPVPVPVRTVHQPYRLGDYELPTGTLLAPNCYSLHRRADLWPEPTVFRPERFLQPPPHKYAWIPFGGGGRHCIGRSFATTEIHVVLRTLLQRARFAASERADEKVTKHGLLLSPGNGARVILEERRPAASASSQVAV